MGSFGLCHPEGAALAAMRERAGEAALGGLLSVGVVDEVWEAVQGRIAAHFIAQYLDAVRRLIES